MKYIVDTGIDELMLASQELEAYARKLWEEHQQVLYLDMVVQDTIYFGICDAEQAERLIFLTGPQIKIQRKT